MNGASRHDERRIGRWDMRGRENADTCYCLLRVEFASIIHVIFHDETVQEESKDRVVLMGHAGYWIMRQKRQCCAC